VSGARTPGNHVLLVGMMGSGKTTTGRALAERLGRPYVDSDEQVERRTSRGVAEIFATDGEKAFRDEERRALAEAVASGRPAVIAVAGGAVLDEANRALIRRAGEVVWLRATPATLAGRVGDGHGRPLLEGDAAATVARLDEVRRPIYEALASAVVDVDGLSPAGVVDHVLAAVLRHVPIPLGERSYEVLVGPGARHRLADVLPPGARRAAVVSQAGIDLEVDPGVETSRFTIGDGERAKTLSTVEELCRGFVGAGLTRADVVVAVGGGVVTDVAGFAAASYHRGVAVVHVPTTLLGQVDAAIGGKTGVNLPEGKNLVGAFWQPRAVLCDTDALTTLPEREWRSGLGEMAKYAFLGVDDLPSLPLVEQIARCVAAKAAVVGADEREGDRRMSLNYGHTLAHALEASAFSGGGGRPALDLRHGEAVAIGLIFAARLAHLLGRIDEARVDRHLEVVEAYGLPAAIPAGLDLDALVALMGRDKKAVAGPVFVLDGPDGVEPVRDVPRELVVQALAASAAGGPAPEATASAAGPRAPKARGAVSP